MSRLTSNVAQCVACGAPLWCPSCEHSVVEAPLEADAISAAKNRVAETALKMDAWKEASDWPNYFAFTRPDDEREFLAALDELRKLKGEG